MGIVYVRGLGERYSSTQLNGAVVPTTEPEKRVVPLDLFPSGLIENIKIAKTYSPDLPAEFSGGLVQMKTIDFPTQRMFTLSVKTGFNTATSFDKFLTYPVRIGRFPGLRQRIARPSGLHSPRSAAVSRTVLADTVAGVWPGVLGQLGADTGDVRAAGARLVRIGRRHLRQVRHRGRDQLFQ